MVFQYLDRISIHLLPAMHAYITFPEKISTRHVGSILNLGNVSSGKCYVLHNFFLIRTMGTST